MRAPRPGRPAVLFCLVVSLVAGLVAAGPASARSAAPAACASRASWVAGSTELCRGALIYRDYVYDDYGADTGEILTASTANLSPTAGDERYEAGEANTADLVRLTLRIAGSRLRVAGELNTLYRADSTVLAIAIDTDGDAATGGGTWGGLDVSSAGWDVFAAFDLGNPKTNMISGSIPVPAGSTWRVQAATAVASTGSVMNVAFRGVNEKARFNTGAAQLESPATVGAWFEDDQAAALAGGDISAFGYEVKVADLRRRVTRPAPPEGAGLHERVYTSRATLPPGEGIAEDGVPGRGNGNSEAPLGFEQAYHYLGKYQPYGIYLPHTPGPWGMQMVFHGTSANLTSLINQPGMQEEFGEKLDRVLVVPEVRGPDGYAADISELDVLEVMADVERTYRIDTSRVFSSGYSQGGYMAYRFSMLFPDRFAGTVSWVGFTGNAMNGMPEPVHSAATYTAGAVGNMIDFVGNVRWSPTIMLASGEDYLVHVTSTLAMNRAFAASESPYTWYLYPAGEHLTYALMDDFSQEASDTKDLRLVKNPPRVTFRTATFLDSPKYGIRHDRAYWVSQIRGRGDGFIDVDLTTHACGGSMPTFETGQFAGVATLPWVSDYRRVAGADTMHRDSMLTGTLSNVKSLRIDPQASCLGTNGFSYDVTTDGPGKVWMANDRVLSFAKAGHYVGRLNVFGPRR